MSLANEIGFLRHARNAIFFVLKRLILQFLRASHEQQVLFHFPLKGRQMVVVVVVVVVGGGAVTQALA